jgi:chorismate mutase-like protein
MTPEEAQDKLTECRAQIDVLDLRLLELLNERARVVTIIGEVKRQTSLPIYEPKREEDVFRNVLGGNRGPLSPSAVRRLFERIIDEMRTLQRERMERANAQEKRP